MSDQKIPAKNDKCSMNEKYSIYESLLQSYRTIFISSQSFLIAIGAILLDSDNPFWLLFTVFVLALVIIWVLWFPVVRARARLVDYYKFGFDSNKLGKDEDDYVHDKEFRNKVNKEVNKINWRPTRRKIDIYLPILFTIIWFALIVARLQMNNLKFIWFIIICLLVH